MPTQPGFKTDSPFARLLASKHLLPADLGIFRNICTRLVRDGETVAPNSPMLPGLAEFLKIPLKTLRGYCKAPPMSEQFEKKIRSQMERGTIPRGEQVVPHSRRKDVDASDVEVTDSAPAVREKLRGADGRSQLRSNSTPFVRMVAERGMTLAGLAEKTKIPQQMMWRLSGGGLAKNHPVIDVIADALGVSVQNIAVHMKLPDLTGPWLARAHHTVASYKAGTSKSQQHAKNGVKGHKAPGTGVVHVPSNGTHAAPVRAGHAQNRLGSKRTEINLRQSARAMVATLNVSIMRGDTHTPNLPVTDLFLVLQDYLVEKGVKGNMLVDPNFAAAFDPK